MRIIYLSIIFLCFTFSGICGQNKVELIGPENDVLYWEVPNLIEIVVDGKILRPTEYDVEIRRWKWQTEIADTTTYDKTDSGLLIHAMAYANEITIKDKRGNVIANKSFKLHNMPDPVVYVDGSSRGGMVPKYYLLNRKGLIPFITSNVFSHDIRLGIKGYDAIITISNETTYLKCTGYLFSDTLKSFIKRMRPFDRLELNEFELTSGRKIFNPIIFEISGEYIDVDYAELISDYEVKVEKPTNVADLDFHTDRFASVATESDCDMQNDYCNLKRIYKYSNGDQVIVNYMFEGLDSMRVETYSKGVLLADFNYYLGELCGPAIIYNLNGHKLLEGNYIVDTTAHDTVMGVDPVTLNEEQTTPFYPRSYKNGEWLYYKNGSVEKRLNCRKGIEMISPKQ